MTGIDALRYSRALPGDSTPCRLDLREWSEYPASGGSPLMGVTLPQDPQTRMLIKALDETNKLHIIELRRGLVVKTTSWVGRITLGSLTITVQPRIKGLPLVRLLRYAYGLHQLELEGDADFAASAESFLDLLIHELAREAERLIRRGLRREYVRREANLSAPRGRINVGQIARSGGVMTAELPCTYYERSEDALLNQALRAGLLLAAGLTADIGLRAGLRRLVADMGDSIRPMRLSGQALLQADRAVSRLTVAYVPALTLIRLLWENQGVSLEEDAPRVELPGFLFDMNRFFQALLSRFLSENLPGCRLEDEHRLKGVFAYDSAFNPRRRYAPTPRPDYVLWQGHKLIAILDAKYRDLWATSLPAEWLYQLAIYAMSQPAVRTATILYPVMGSAAEEARIRIHDPVRGGSRAQVIVRPVDMIELDAVLGAGRGAVAVRRRQALAAKVAFGSTRL